MHRSAGTAYSSLAASLFDFQNLSSLYLAATFLLYAVMATALLAANMPPFQNPDEPRHYLRATQIAQGELVGYRFAASGPTGMQVSAGGMADPAVLRAAAPFDGVVGHPERRVTFAQWDAASVPWSYERTLLAFPNTALYPPFFYVPSAFGVAIGRALDLTVVQSLTLSRVLTGVAAAAVGGLAIACAGAASIWIFAILTLPMSLSLMASASQDGLLLAFSALAGALMFRALNRPQAPTVSEMAGLVGSLVLVAMARPPYAGLAILLLELRSLRWRRLIAFLTVVASAGLWSALMATTTWINVGAFELIGADPAGQWAHIRQDPFVILQVAVTTIAHNFHFYFDSFIGKLGWLDTKLPGAYHAAASAILCIAAIAAIVYPSHRFYSAKGCYIAFGLLVSAGGVFAIQYLTWTRPGSAIVEGVQGRYFLPLVVAGAGLLPALGTRWWPRIYCGFAAIVVLFPMVTVWVVMRQIMLRYYQ